MYDINKINDLGLCLAPKNAPILAPFFFSNPICDVPSRSRKLQLCQPDNPLHNGWRARHHP